ncbi:MAG: hypothetical protein IJA97_04140 [Clostridia bacterium]|nr:hypothetical protein [Clostridia bacterium]
MGKRFKIAGIVMEIAYKFSYTEDMLKKYEYFGGEPTAVTVRIDEDDFKSEVLRSNGEPDCFIENSAILRKLSNILLQDYNAMLFHGSTVKYNDKAYIFTAPSGTGKSTHTKLLKEYLGDKITYINDDKPILKVEGDGVMVYGSPWNGKHGLGENTCAPLEAICVVTRADTNSIEKVSPVSFMQVLFEQSMGFDDEVGAGKVLEILSSVLSGAKFYLLKCNMDISAAKCSHEGMML